MMARLRSSALRAFMHNAGGGLRFAVCEVSPLKGSSRAVVIYDAARAADCLRFELERRDSQIAPVAFCGSGVVADAVRAQVLERARA